MSTHDSTVEKGKIIILPYVYIIVNVAKYATCKQYSTYYVGYIPRNVEDRFRHITPWDLHNCYQVDTLVSRNPRWCSVLVRACLDR
jgi:hypothetical protein